MAGAIADPTEPDLAESDLPRTRRIDTPAQRAAQRAQRKKFYREIGCLGGLDAHGVAMSLRLIPPIANGRAIATAGSSCNSSGRSSRSAPTSPRCSRSTR